MDERLGDLEPMETSHLININPVTVSIRNPVALSNIKNPITMTNMRSPVTISNIRNPVIVTSIGNPVTMTGSPVTVTKNVTITPRFTANYSITPQERLNIITVHNPTDNNRVFTT